MICVRFDVVNFGRYFDLFEYEKFIEEFVVDELFRIMFFKVCLIKLGLEVSRGIVVFSFFKFYVFFIYYNEVGEFFYLFDDIIIKEDGDEYIKGENDFFYFEKLEFCWDLIFFS